MIAVLTRWTSHNTDAIRQYEVNVAEFVAATPQADAALIVGDWEKRQVGHAGGLRFLREGKLCSDAPGVPILAFENPDEVKAFGAPCLARAVRHGATVKQILGLSSAIEGVIHHATKAEVRPRQKTR